MTKNWRCYFPDCDETAEEAEELNTPVDEKISIAAEEACEMRYYDRDGADDHDEYHPFTIVLIDASNVEHRFAGWAKKTVELFTEPAEAVDA